MSKGFSSEVARDPKKPPRILIFSHLLAYLETWQTAQSPALKVSPDDDWLVNDDRVNLEALRQVWRVTKSYL